MKNKTKKLLTAICTLLFSVFMFAGCNLIEINKHKYYNQEVVVVSLKEGYGEKYKGFEKTYYKKDLLNAYYSYSYEYVNNGQLDVKSGVTYAINNMVNNDLIYNYIKVNYFDNGTLTYTAADANDVKWQAYKSMQDSIYNLEKEIFEEWNINYTNEDELSDEQTESLRVTYEEYVPSVKLITTLDGENKIILNDTSETLHDTRPAPEHFVQDVRHEGVSREAYTRYVKQLQDSAKAMGDSFSEKTVIENEEKRLIKIYEQAKYLEIFENWYNKTYNFTFDQELNEYVLNQDIMDEVVSEYKEKYEAQKVTYANETKYHEAMAGDDVSGVYYHPNGGNEYVYVSHILMKFSDAQIKKIEELDKKLEKGVITEDRYNELVQDIADRTVVTYELDGETYTSTAAKVYDKINNYVGRGGEATDRAKLFNDMIYVYNDDEGIMNSDFAYVVNLDTQVKDKMVAPFANKAREMHATGNVGDISEMVITEYGVHILFYAGVADNVVNDINSLTAFDLIKVKTQLSSNKSLFDMIYDTVATEAYESDATNFIAECRDFIVSVDNKEDNYKDLYK